MRLLLSTVTLALLLAGCGDSDAPTQSGTASGQDTGAANPDQPTPPVEQPNDAPLTSKSQTLTRESESCPDDPCSKVALQWLTFPEDTSLTRALESTLLEQLSNGADDGASSFAAVADGFLFDAREAAEMESMGWELNAKVSLLGERAGLVTLQLDSYEITGGAHGMPVVQLLNWDRREQRRATLQDVLQPGREDAFWKAAAEVHQQWLANDIEADKDFRDTWPFLQTGDFHVTDQGVALLYNVYSIAPYAMGQPELTVPWTKLEGLIQERYRP
ncbi:Lipoprotein [Alloalcanivorax dieselolei B5]|uniref:Lipoprotein n=1 Tax=Alcanivorax dieselolei (strain DSM 16502 / CGMCC 1.3690 / MCCC 1A00001 / B-5) TaxID=930169 RepID=K0CAG4_ALCDB|nr:DUF3298 and DUF4163 domain-containing protein [Alloalcanivorax dieselolei]AFT68436.1 Lipoprotein [Alloalcanivorax dieselolei B5]GGJ99704.1 DUF3298 domain-containing protein [Alloalcanivorax dieselolei]